MKVTQKRQHDGTVKINAQASASELRNALDYAYGAFAQSVGLFPEPGQSIEQAASEKLGITNLSALIQPYLEERLAALAIDKANIAPAFEPKSVALAWPESGKGISFEFAVVPKPAFELSSYEPIAISVVRPVVFEEDIEREMASYAQFMGAFDDPDKERKLRELVVAKLEDLGERSFLNQKRQAASIEVAKRLEGSISDHIITAMFAELLDGLKAQLKASNTPFQDFLEEHGGEENVNMLLMWQARETLRQGYALDAVFRHEGLSVSQADIDDTCCTISGLSDADAARRNARAMGKMHTVRETAQRFKAADWLLEHADVTVRDRSPLEEASP